MASEIRVNSIHSRTGLSTVSLTDTGAVLSGIVSATTFSGPLTGDVTGNVTGNVTSTGGHLSGISTVSTTRLVVNGNAYPSAGPLSNRNLIINGGMNVAQRGISSTSGGYHTVDRWGVVWNSGSVTQTQETADPDTTAGDSVIWDIGFRNFLRLTNTTADTSAASYRAFVQYIESRNMANSGWDYENSNSYVTLSFWMRVSHSQEFFAYVTSEDGSTSQSYRFSIGTPAINTWTKVVKTIPGGANVQFDNNSEKGLTIAINPWWGADYTDPSVSSNLNSWNNLDYTQRSPDYATTWASQSGATFDITGAQLEVGSVATPFEHCSFGDELYKCQRYYSTSADYQATIDSRGGFFGVPYPGGSLAYGNCVFPTIMRDTPNVTIYDNNGLAGNCTQWGSAHALAATPSNISQNGFQVVDRTSPANFVDDARYAVSAGYTADAEL